MRLLVSVSSANEARVAEEGGADIIDAKDPSRGALGAVTADELVAIRAAVSRDRIVTAALGDADREDGLEAVAGEFVARGAAFVKVGFGGVRDERCVEEILTRTCRSVGGDGGVVAVAYADGLPGSIDAKRLVLIAARSGARGMLVDTADKRGPALMQLWDVADLEAWVAEVHAHGLFAAVAGRVGADDVAAVGKSGADIVGVRSAACDGGRRGTVSVERVRALRSRVGT